MLSADIHVVYFHWIFYSEITFLVRILLNNLRYSKSVQMYTSIISRRNIKNRRAKQQHQQQYQQQCGACSLYARLVANFIETDIRERSDRWANASVYHINALKLVLIKSDHYQIESCLPLELCYENSRIETFFPLLYFI